MNLLYLHCHDAGRWLSPYGMSAATPHLQRFAESSLLFRQAHTANPTCSPSRACLLTGQWAHQQMFGLAHRGFALQEPAHHLGNFLKGHGYQTALCGVQHEFGVSQEGFPYDVSKRVQGPRPDPMDRDGLDRCVAEEAATYLANVDREKPFFLSVGFFWPHREYPSVHRVNPDYVKVPDDYPDTPPIREDIAGHMAATEEMDAAAGRVLSALEAYGHAENTIVVFTTDHGPPFPFMKCTLKDAGTGVALMLRAPGRTEVGVTDALVSQVDLFPTFCDLLELPKPDWLEGQSLVPVLEKPESDGREELFTEVNYHGAYEPKRAIRTQRYKLILNCDESHHTVPMANTDGGPSKSEFLAYDFPNRVRPRLELYDLVYDAAERNNLADDPDYAAVRDELLAKLVDWQERTNDPILQGRIPAPPGAKVDAHQAMDPA